MRSVFNQRFTEGVTCKLQVDIQNVMDVIKNNKKPTYDEGVDISVQHLDQKGEFSKRYFMYSLYKNTKII